MTRSALAGPVSALFAGVPAIRPLLALYLVLIPLSWTPFPWNIQWSELAFVGLLACAVAVVPRVNLRFHVVDLLALLALGGPLLSLVTATDPLESGVQYAKHLYLALVYAVFVVIGASHSLRAVTAFWLGIVAAVLAGMSLLGVAIYLFFGVEVARLGPVISLPYLGEVYRAHGLFHSAEYFANFLTFVLPMVLAVGFDPTVVSRSRREGWRLASFLIVLATAATFAHGVAGALVSGLAYGWRFLARRGLLRATALVMAVVVVIGVNVLLVVAVRDVRYGFSRDPAVDPPGFLHAFQGDDGAPTVTVSVSYNWISYYLLKQVAWDAFRREPLMGIGLGKFPQETERAYREGKLREEYRALTPHSTWLGTLAEAGLAGAFPLLFLWIGILALGSRRVQDASPGSWVPRAAFAGLLGLLVNSINVDVMHFRFLWVGLGLLRGASKMGVDGAARA